MQLKHAFSFSFGQFFLGEWHSFPLGECECPLVPPGTAMADRCFGNLRWAKQENEQLVA